MSFGKKNKSKDNSEIAILAQVKMFAEDIRFLIPRNSDTEVFRDTWPRG